MRPTRLEVDLSAFVSNAKLAASVSKAPVWCVVKANAYGSGAVQVSRVLEPIHEVRGFAVSLVEEGIELREAGVQKPIIVMGPALSGSFEKLLALSLMPVLSSVADAEALAKYAEKNSVKAPVHIKVDTGMGRLGFQETGEVHQVLSNSHLDVRGITSHFSNADLEKDGAPGSKTESQISAFEAWLKEPKLAALEKHISNSAGAFIHQSAQFDSVRVGLALLGHGGFHSGLKPALQLRTEISQVRDVKKGGTVSYGSLWVAPRNSRVAVLPLGYADGIPKRGTGKLAVSIAGHRVPIVGAVSMDMIVADVTNLPAVSPGEPVAVWGDGTVTASDFAKACSLNEYEVSCGVSVRVPRTYVNSPE